MRNLEGAATPQEGHGEGTRAWRKILEKRLEEGETLSPAELAELKALQETGDPRVAFLEAKKIKDGKLSGEEENELAERRKPIVF